MSPAGTALRAIMDIQALKTVAYEALTRPEGSSPTVEHVRAALAVGRHTTPAVLIVPLSPALLQDESFDPVREVREAGLSPVDVAFVLADARDGISSACLRRAEQLHAAGCLVGLDGAGARVLSDTLAGELRPSFVMIEPGLTDRGPADQRLRAELAALLAYFARLGGRLIARDVADAAYARTLLELGIQFGTGAYLGSPVVLQDAMAVDGDEIVQAGWFRGRAVRVLAERPESAGSTTLLKSVPYADQLTAPVGDREFARTLAEAARLLQAEHDPARIIGVIGDLLPRVVPVDRLAVFEADWDHHLLRAKLVIGEELAGLLDMDDSMSTGITGWAFPRGVPYNCPDTEHHPAAASVPGSPAQTEESLVVIPLIAGDHRLGALDLWRDGLAQFTEVDVERASLFGYLAAAAWRNAQLYAELERRAMTDTLTGLLNTRWWSELAPREAAQSRRLGTQIAILLCDLDHFKTVNDRFGHAAGDVVLRCTARVLREAVRTGDAAVRYGGEEFLLVVRESDEEGALRVARAVQDGLRAMPTPIEGLPPLTASIGIAFFPRHGNTLDEVLGHADSAMYQAKHEGRDRIVFANAVVPSVSGGL